MNRQERIRIENPQKLCRDSLPAERNPIGIPGDYKPCIGRFSDNELLVVAFRATEKSEAGETVISEKMILFRSFDQGRSWQEEQIPDMSGREFYLSILSDDSIVATATLLPQDTCNTAGYMLNLLLRSGDRGKTWQRRMLGREDVPGAVQENPFIFTSRNILELRDGTLLYGVGTAGRMDIKDLSGSIDYLWVSPDRGETWEPDLRCTFNEVDQSKIWCPIWSEGVMFEKADGSLLTLLRVDQKAFPPIPGTIIPKEEADHYERLVLFKSINGGQDWHPQPETGAYYGEMYPAILRLQDGRLLLTFTVRAAVAPRPPRLGVQAVLGRETDEGIAFDYEHDRIVLDEKTPIGQISGGGFGPTVQLSDGTLVTCYSYSGPGKWPQDIHLEIVRWTLP